MSTIKVDDITELTVEHGVNIDGVEFHKGADMIVPHGGSITLEPGSTITNKGFATGFLALPIGMVSMWAGNQQTDLVDLNAQGWFLCDGGINAGDHPKAYWVPDLAGKFIKGADGPGQDVGEMGGSGQTESHTLLINEMPVHNHSASTGSHSHRHGPQQAESGASGGSYEKRKRQVIAGHGGEPGSYNTYVGTQGSFGSVTFGTSNWNTDYQAHSHSVTVNPSAGGGGHNHIVEPIFYKLAYVIFLGAY